MLTWQQYKNLHFNVNSENSFEEISSSGKVLCQVYYLKDNSELYFGFITDLGIQNPELLIFEIQTFARSHKFKKIIGPIDGQTWNNYRFQWKSELGIEYLGEPIYSKALCQKFLDSGFLMSEKYETVEIESLEKFIDGVLSFSAFDLPGIEFEMLNEAHFTEYESQFADLLNEVFSDNVGFNRLQKNEVQFILNQIQKTVSYPHSAVVFNQRHELVGFLICFLSEQNLFLKTIGLKKNERRQGLTVLKLLSFIFENKSKSTERAFGRLFVCLMRSGNFPSLLSSLMAKKKNEYVLLEKIL